MTHTVQALYDIYIQALCDTYKFCVTHAGSILHIMSPKSEMRIQGEGQSIGRGGGAIGSDEPPSSNLPVFSSL